METYHLHCHLSEQGAIKEILRKHHDVIINESTKDYIGITIEKDRKDADLYYHHLLEGINRELHLAVR